ncbi:MAG: DEAD/DEAH box helicase, partial [Thermoleophilia bacterium]|nr:DEAD/DEAH box helicase [Thermoleophilia bacterium]
NPPKGSGRRIRVLVLSPTRELALQIGESFETYGAHTGLRTLCIYGGVNQNRQTKALQHGVDILVATPGRLLDLINQGFVRLTQVGTLVLDEADRMLDMGFMPDIRRIVKLLPEERQTLLFSATMPTAIEALAHDILTNPEEIKLTPEKPATELVTQSVHMVQQSKKTSL